MHKNTDELERKLLNNQKKAENKLQHSQSELERKIVLTFDEKLKKSTKKLNKKIKSVESSIPDIAEMVCHRQFKKNKGLNLKKDSGSNVSKDSMDEDTVKIKKRSISTKRKGKDGAKDGSSQNINKIVEAVDEDEEDSSGEGNGKKMKQEDSDGSSSDDSSRSSGDSPKMVAFNGEDEDDGDGYRSESVAAQAVDLTNYFTKEEILKLLDQKIKEETE